MAIETSFSEEQTIFICVFNYLVLDSKKKKQYLGVLLRRD